MQVFIGRRRTQILTGQRASLPTSFLAAAAVPLVAMMSSRSSGKMANHSFLPMGLAQQRPCLDFLPPRASKGLCFIDPDLRYRYQKVDRGFAQFRAVSCSFTHATGPADRLK